MDVIMKELFGSYIGLLSLFTIAFMVVMGLFIWYKLAKNSKEEQ